MSPLHLSQTPVSAFSITRPVKAVGESLLPCLYCLSHVVLSPPITRPVRAVGESMPLLPITCAFSITRPACVGASLQPAIATSVVCIGMPSFAAIAIFVNYAFFLPTAQAQAPAPWPVVARVPFF